jgi:hemoglobin
MFNPTPQRPFVQAPLPGLLAAAGLVLALNMPVLAQPSAPASSELFEALGGRAGLVVLMDDFMQRLLADPRMRPFFEEADQQRIKEKLVLQLCEVLGGPCRYDGKDMKKSHEGVDIDKSQFNALVEVLQDSMSARGVPFRAQNQLLARLAPMHRQIINLPR